VVVLDASIDVAKMCRTPGRRWWCKGGMPNDN